MPRKRSRIKTFFLGVAAVLGILALLLGIVTDGFQVWEIFKQKPQAKLNPIIDIRIEPYRFHAGTTSVGESGKVSFIIQSTNGAYQLNDSLKIDTFIVLKKNFFIDTMPYFFDSHIEITKTFIDRRLLDNKFPETNGYIEFQPHYLFNGTELGSMYLSERAETVAKFVLSFPYTYENEKFAKKVEVPVIVYD